MPASTLPTVAGGTATPWRRCANFLLSALWILLATLTLLPPPPATASIRHREALDAAGRGDWETVRNRARAMRGSLWRDYFLWRELTESDRPLRFEEVRAFLDRHGDWPRSARLRRRVEESLGPSIPASAILAYFGKFPPLTGRGRLMLASALLDRGDRKRAFRELAAAWPSARLTAKEERWFRRRFGSRISRSLEEARLDRLLWDGRTKAARRLLPRVSRGRRQWALARIALQERIPGVDSAIRRVPPALRRDPGFLFDRLRWRVAKGRRKAARELLLHPPADLVRPAAWWHIRRAEVWRLMGERRFRTAHRLLLRHGQKDGATRAEAEWLAGWIELRMLGDPGKALARFAALHAAVTTPVSRARMAYWAGRAAAASGDAEKAARWYRRARRYPTTFYGQEAARELGRALPLVPLPEPRIDPEILRSYDADSRVRMTRLLCDEAAGGLALPFLRRLAAEADERVEARLVLRLASSCDRPDLAVAAAKRLVRRGLVPRMRTFPLPEFPADVKLDHLPVEPALLLAMARQESHFDLGAHSPAGAWGMMQILPRTARPVAARNGLPFSLQRLTGDPHYQLLLAASYVRTLLESFGGRLPVAIAAYNAGPARVRRWLSLLGTPEDGDRHASIDWIESLPYAETRNYVQRVLEGLRVYEQLLQERERYRALRIRIAAGRMSLPLPKLRPEGGS